MTTHDADIHLLFNVTDEKAFRDFIWKHPDAKNDWVLNENNSSQSVAGMLLELFMFMAATLPGVEIYAGGGEMVAGDDQAIPGRTAEFHRHVTEHAHPVARLGGKPHYHMDSHYTRLVGSHYVGPLDLLGADLLSDRT